MNIKEIYDFIMKRKLLAHAFHLFPIGFLGVCTFLYPIWWMEGYLDGWYPKIGAGIAVYGGFIGNLVWYIQWIGRNK